VQRRLEYENESRLFVAATRTPLDGLLSDFIGHLRTRHPDKSVSNDISRLRCLFGPIVPVLARRHSHTADSIPSRLAAAYVEQITLQMVNQRLDERARTLSAKTVNEDRKVLHRLFKYAIEYKGMVHPDRRTPNPAAAVKRRRVGAPVIRFLRQNEIREQILALVDDPVVCTAAAIMIYAGLRRSEALWFALSDVNLKRRLISVAAKVVDDDPPQRHVW
jgi:integrase